MLDKNLHHHIFSMSHRQGKGGYDLPLHTRMGTEFLVLLICLMTYLLFLFASGNLSLKELSQKWVSGLENTVTIEIPSDKTTDSNVEKLMSSLRKIDSIKSVDKVTQSDMSAMLSPWLGNDKTILDNLPLPILISVELEKRTDATITKLKNTTNSLIPQAIVDAHEDWLTDLLHLTKTLRLTALAVFVLILGVTAIVISGAVRSRMAMHQRELELLHIMGATDNYICLQFVRYILAQIIKGIGFGLILGLLTGIVFFLFANQTSGMMIGLHISLYDVLVYASIPVLLIVIGIMTAYKTSYSVLHEMP